MSKRVFLAVDLPPNVRNALYDAGKALPRDDAKLSLAARENLHVTLHFLGDLEDAELPKVFEAVETGAMRCEPFEFRVRGLATIPPKGRNLRMVWGSVDDPAGGLVALYESIGLEFIEAGLAVEDRPYTPHVTVARVKFARRPDAIRGAAERTSETIFGVCQATRVTVYESTLTREGPIYTALGHCLLAGGSVE
jgi:2'-5' RNA ligase